MLTNDGYPKGQPGLCEGYESTSVRDCEGMLLAMSKGVPGRVSTETDTCDSPLSDFGFSGREQVCREEVDEIGGVANGPD